MSRSLYLPYRPANPRTVRGAKKRGWRLVEPQQGMNHVSWIGLNIWAERAMSGYWVSSYALHTFAFERDSDAVMFQLKWG
jgi:hypothetical protein